MILQALLTEIVAFSAGIAISVTGIGDLFLSCFHLRDRLNPLSLRHYPYNHDTVAIFICLYITVSGYR